MQDRASNFYKYFKDVIKNNLEILASDLEYNSYGLSIEERHKIITQYKNWREDQTDYVLNELEYDDELEREINETIQYFIKQELGVDY